MGLDITNATTLNSSLDVGNAVINLSSTIQAVREWKGLLGSLPLSVFLNVSVNESEFPRLSPNLSSSSSFISSVNLSDLSDFFDLGIKLESIQPLPWFDNAESAIDEDLDNQIAADLNATLNRLTEINASTGYTLDFRSLSLYSFPGAANAIQAVSNMPWGNVRFSKATNGSYAYLFQAGMDSRLSNVVSYPSEGLRRMAFQTMIMNAICNSFPKFWLMLSETIWISSHDCTRVPCYASAYQSDIAYPHKSFECQGPVSFRNILFHPLVCL